MNLAITGTSGNIGGMVARHLNTRGLPLILPLRNPAKAPALPELRGATVCLWRFGSCQAGVKRGGRAVYGVRRRKPDARAGAFDFGAGCFGSGRATHGLSLFCTGGVGQHLHAGAYPCGYRKCDPANEYALHLSARQFLQRDDGNDCQRRRHHRRPSRRRVRCLRFAARCRPSGGKRHRRHPS